MTTTQALSKLSIYKKQFSANDAIRFLSCKVIQKFLDPSQIESYGQTGEDRVIDFLLKGVDRGFYVDVGCNEPHRYSNTFFLYKKGWKGIVIDGNSKLVKSFKKRRPNDLCVTALVSNSDEPIEFVEFKDSRVSSVSPAHIKRWSNHTNISSRQIVQPQRLDSILEENNAPLEFELLSIDVERHDFEALLSIDLSKYRPKLIVVEMHDFSLHKPESNAIYKHLLNWNYRLENYSTVNGYFVLNS